MRCSKQEKKFNNNVRRGEASKLWFRSGRFFSVDSRWYFTIRNNRHVGPFESRKAASRGLELFIECINKQGASVEHAVSIATKSSWEIVGFR